MSSSHSLSAAEQQTLLTAARFAVVRFACYFTDKTGHKSFFTKEDIEDLVQDAALKAWRSLESYNPDRAKLSTWVTRIAVNCVKDSIDYKMKRLGISESMFTKHGSDDKEVDATEVYDCKCDLAPEIQCATYCFSADSEIERKEIEQGVLREVRKLGDRNERVVRLLLEEYTPREIAEVEGCTPNAAATRVCRIRRVLRASLAGELALHSLAS